MDAGSVVECEKFPQKGREAIEYCRILKESSYAGAGKMLSRESMERTYHIN